MTLPETKTNPEKLKFVKVFGERHSGTRAFVQMLRAVPHVRLRAVRTAGINALSESFDIAALERKISAGFSGDWSGAYSSALGDLRYSSTTPTLVWKHAAAEWHNDYVTTKAHVVFIVRNPYSWLISMAKMPYHIKGPRSASLQGFLDRPWMTEQRDNLRPLLASPMELWNRKTASYGEFAIQAKANSVPVQFQRFEDFIQNPESEVTQVLDGLGIAGDGVRDIQHSTKEDTRSLDEIRSFYRAEGWKLWLTSDDVAMFNNLVNWELAFEHGYERLDPAQFPQKLPMSTNRTIRKALLGK